MAEIDYTAPKINPVTFDKRKRSTEGLDMKAGDRKQNQSNNPVSETAGGGRGREAFIAEARGRRGQRSTKTGNKYTSGKYKGMTIGEADGKDMAKWRKMPEGQRDKFRKVTSGDYARAEEGRVKRRQGDADFARSEAAKTRAEVYAEKVAQGGATGGGNNTPYTPPAQTSPVAPATPPAPTTPPILADGTPSSIARPKAPTGTPANPTGDPNKPMMTGMKPNREGNQVANTSSPVKKPNEISNNKYDFSTSEGRSSYREDDRETIKREMEEDRNRIGKPAQDKKDKIISDQKVIDDAMQEKLDSRAPMGKDDPLYLSKATDAFKARQASAQLERGEIALSRENQRNDYLASNNNNKTVSPLANTPKEPTTPISVTGIPQNKKPDSVASNSPVTDPNKKKKIY